MRTPGSDVLAKALAPLRDMATDTASVTMIGAMTSAEMVAVIVEQADAATVAKAGHRCTAPMLRSMAQQAEAMAAEYRRIAADREREAS